MKLTVFYLFVYHLSTLGSATSSYDSWVADLEPGMIIKTIYGEGKTCHCKVLTSTSTSPVTTSTTTTSTTTTTTTTKNPQPVDFYGHAPCDVDLVVTPTTDMHWKSPNYPSNYPDGVTCNLTVTVPADMKYSVIKMTPSADSLVYGTPYCRHDNLQYISSLGSVSRYCQRLQVITVISTTDVPKKFFLRFESTSADGGMTERGFDFHITAVSTYG
ncbi:uncharacterized protein LOC135224176 isoform X2 [Macrobrachium nipponense]|uniref:uncharacterized protein LOC135224176 isoform X2 n=1 Tax=Macrobrachium nipponense TaxID=159736 RepID=UPI0030C7F96A